MSNRQPLEDVLDAYPSVCRPRKIVPLGWAGGLSGATFWRLETELGPLCLRRFSAGPVDAQRLDWIRAVQQHVEREGFRCVPVPIATTAGQGYVELSGHAWELTPWLCGRADYHVAPSGEKLAAAMTALAEFHAAAASFPHAGAREGIAPAVLGRLQRIEQLNSGGIERLECAAAQQAAARNHWGVAPGTRNRACTSSIASQPGVQIAARFAPIVAGYRRWSPALQEQLSALQHAVRLQPCIRDIHDRHVLFEGACVTGLVDFGALRVDNVATDVARLLGTMAGDDTAARGAALAAYQRRRLTQVERRLVDVLDRANVILSGVQWLEWLLIDGRQFEDPAAVFERIDLILGRLNRVEPIAAMRPSDAAGHG